MPDRILLATADEVRGLLEGRITRVRRPVKPQPARCLGNAVMEPPGHDDEWPDGRRIPADHWRLLDGCNVGDYGSGPWEGSIVWAGRCAFGAPGDRLVVKETWAPHPLDEQVPPERVLYLADGANHDTDGRGPNVLDAPQWQPKRWRSSATMPRWASRLTLEVLAVGAERLFDVTDDSARKEGIVDGGCYECGESEPCGCDNPTPMPADAFFWEWTQRYGEHGPLGWFANPWTFWADVRRTT